MKNNTEQWSFQWSTFFNDNNLIENDLSLFKDWIYPNRLEDFSGKSVIDCGCGRGQHLKFVLPYLKDGVGIDLNTSEIAQRYLNDERVSIVKGDIPEYRPGRLFDIVYSIGVLHHTDDPTRSFNNIKTFCKPGGRVIVWVYSREGNFLNRTILEPLNRMVFMKMDRRFLLALSWITAALLYVPIYTLYLLPLRFLPFYDYFANFRRLSFGKNFQNVFDKLNAPQTHFIDAGTINKWFNAGDFDDIHISRYAGVSWRASGTLKKTT